MAAKGMPDTPATAKAGKSGPVTRAVHDVTGAAEALTVGAVQLTRHTLAAAVETVEDVGGRVGSLAVTTVRGAARAASDIGGDLGELARGTVQGSLVATREIGGEVGSLAVDAVEGAVRAIDRIGTAAGRSLRDAVAGTVAGVRTVLAEAGLGTAGQAAPGAEGAPARRPLARMAKGRRPAPARKSA
jgi:hypothetical protein